MNIDKEQFLDDLQMVKPGLSQREFLEQSNSFVFRDGHVITFNDEIACRKKTELKFEGAVPSGSLLAILEKLPDKMLEVHENQNGELEFRGKNRRFGITRDVEVLLPIEKVEEEKPERWLKLPQKFSEIVNAVKDCVSTDEVNKFALTCVHLHPEHIEACNNQHMLRWRVKLGLKRSLLVRGTALAEVIGLGVTEISSTESWIHFRNEKKGFIFSVRKFVEEYPNLDDVLNVEGEKITFRKELISAADRADIFASEMTKGITPKLLVTLRPGKITVAGTGMMGWYRETKKCGYKGPRREFGITPTLLIHITENYNEAVITDRKLKAAGGAEGKEGNWDYVTTLSRKKTPDEEQAEAKAEKQKEAPVEAPAETPEEDGVPF